MSDEPTMEGKRLIDRWREAERHLEQRRQAVNAAECELANAISDLGKWGVPDDAKEGEKFCVWYGDSLIEITYVRRGCYGAKVRSRGKSMP